MSEFLGAFKARTDWNLGTLTVLDGGDPVDLTAEGVTVACQLRPHEFDATFIDVTIGLDDGEDGIAALSAPHADTDVSPGTWVGDVAVYLPDLRRVSETFEITVLATVTVVEEESP